MTYSKPGDGLSGARSKKAEASIRLRKPLNWKGMSPAAEQALMARDDRLAVAAEVEVRLAYEAGLRRRFACEAMSRMAAASRKLGDLEES